MADIRFLNVDLDLESKSPLDTLLTGLGDAVVVLHQEQVNDRYAATLEITADPKTAEATILQFCHLLEQLPKHARAVWDRCDTRVFDIGFDAGDSPRSLRSVLDPDTVKRVAALGAGINITIYAPAAN